MLLFRDDGRGEVWQRTWSERRIRASAGAAAVGMLVLASGWGFSGGDADAVVAENLRLRTRLAMVEAELADVEPVMRRVRAYDEELRDLARRQALPGFGPVDEAAMAEREAWLNGVSGVHARPVNGGVLERAEEVVRLASEIREEALAMEQRLPGLDAALERLTALSDGLPEAWPVQDAVLSSAFGYRKHPFTRTWKFHGGIDLSADWGSPVVSTAAGLVTLAEYQSGYGQMIVIEHGTDASTRYGHLSSMLVTPGDEVLAGDLIGLVGSTGQSTGPHLHYELWVGDERVDPMVYLP